ncbi:MAG: peptide chain release factor N(5)-glutamine methyltransferase [Gemmatimonadetes bacterium]|nr:peptide chain release factor N(5)-glutamine methyltransferase [Gemmatimonadota bacterium]
MRASPLVRNVTVTLGSLLDDIARHLGTAGLPARADARDLIAAVLDKPRFWPSAHPELEVDAAVAGRVREAAERFRTGMPMQYAAGRAAFRGLTLDVDRRVLIQRPETELLVDIVLSGDRPGGTVADVCTGSGAIALALATEGRFERVIGTDLSTDALDVARANHAALAARGLTTAVEWRQGDLLAPLAGERLRALVANPPYIAPVEGVDLPPAVRDWEPHLALFSDDDGMAAIRAIVRGAADLLEPGGLLAVEIDARRAGLARACADADPRWRGVAIRMDLTGRERFLVAQRNDAP